MSVNRNARSRHRNRLRYLAAQNAKKINAAFADETTLRCYGLLGQTKGLIWIQNPHHTWKNAAKPDYEPRPTRPTTLIIKNLPPGKWTLETFDPHAGKTIKSQSVMITADRILKIPLPQIEWDAAFSLHR